MPHAKVSRKVPCTIAAHPSLLVRFGLHAIFITNYVPPEQNLMVGERDFIRQSNGPACKRRINGLPVRIGREGR